MRQIVVTVDPDRPRDGRTDELTWQLRTDLRRMPDLLVRDRSLADEAGGKSSAATEIGTLVVSGLFSISTLRSLIAVMGEFLLRSKASSIVLKQGDLEVTMTGVVTREQREILELMIGNDGDASAP